MDKVLGKINQTRLNWYQAFKGGIGIKGYDYYKHPAELKYRYPAPGSCALDEVDHPHLYKKHWKTPYRESPYNIQKRERRITDEEGTETFASHFPEFDPTNFDDQALMREVLPSYAGKKPMFDQENMSVEERQEELQNAFASQAQVMKTMTHDYAPWQWQLDQDYAPKQFIWRERGFYGFENDAIMREIFVELEYMIENVIGYNRIKEKKLDMLKGTPKKWQVLDDSAFDREQVTKLQVAIKAPLPEELEMYQEKHSKPMTLPPTNANVSAWRDDTRAIDSADFDPQFLEYDRERRKKFFLERYEKPKELAEQ